jgi:hypothetical protein
MTGAGVTYCRAVWPSQSPLTRLTCDPQVSQPEYTSRADARQYATLMNTLTCAIGAGA